MSDRVEVRPARRAGTLEMPKQWVDWYPEGPPQDEDERAGWILACIAEGRARRAAGENVPWLRRTSPAQARLEMLARQVPPAVAARLRQQMLDARRTGP